jgi:hypothetical protein
MDEGKEAADATEQNVTAPLIELLKGIDFSFDQQPDDPRTVQREQEQYAAACAVVGRFLMKFEQKYADRFFVLSDAFYDLTVGARPRIFRPLKLRSPPNPTEIEAAKANVAFALDALIKLGQEPRSAARTLLGKYPAIKNLAAPKSHRSGKPWESTILEWRKSMSAPSRRKNEVAADIFTAGRALIDGWIRQGRLADLKDRALGRAKHAAQIGLRVGVFVAGSNPH